MRCTMKTTYLFRARAGPCLVLAAAIAVAAMSACFNSRGQAAPADLAEPGKAAQNQTDSLVVLYYRPTDCFSCFGVLGDWVQLANEGGFPIWLALDDLPKSEVAIQIKKLRLPFTVGIKGSADHHGARPAFSVKEVLFVGGGAVDSDFVRLGSTGSPLARKLRAALESRTALTEVPHARKEP